MKALSIKNPWASLIINGYKEYEFRTWKTKYRGKILIHSSLGIEKNVLNKFKDYSLDYNNGYIIGEATLSDCILVTDEFYHELLNIDSAVYELSTHEMKYAWKLENIIKYENPIKAKGNLGLWNYEVEK